MTDAWTLIDAGRILHRPTAADDKYSRGVLGVRTGSDTYPGAAVLGVEAAWRAGVGMVRYLGPARAADLVLHRRPETVVASGRVQAWLIGSGTDAASRTSEETDVLRALLDGDLPVVADAGALALGASGSAPRILTPHDREHARLRDELGLAADAGDRAASAADTAARTGAVVVLKGAVTVVAAPDGRSILVESGAAWLATAGTGDVLAGTIGAVVAGGAGRADLADLAATGVWLHGRAATLAASARGSAGGPITALDVAEALPLAVGEVLAAA